MLPPRWLICAFPLLLLTGCATPAAPPAPPTEPPPPALAAPCAAGPDYPPGEPRLADLLAVVAHREAAAAECRARHHELVNAWPR